MTRFDRLFPYVRPYRQAIIGGLFCVVISNLAGIAAPWLLGRAIDALTTAGVTLRLISIYAALIVGTAMVSGIARFGMRQLLNGVSRRIENDLRDDRQLLQKFMKWLRAVRQKRQDCK
jgi:ATP-binding cassette subfamily B protein